MSVWLATIYRAEAQTLSIPGEPAPEVADAILAVATAHLVGLGYKVTDVGSTQSFDLDARRGLDRLKVEVKRRSRAAYVAT
jgi:hypothetical protein